MSKYVARIEVEDHLRGMKFRTMGETLQVLEKHLGVDSAIKDAIAYQILSFTWVDEELEDE